MAQDDDRALEESFLRALPRSALEKLLKDAFKIEVPAGGLIYREGADPRAVLVVDGLIRVYMSSALGRQVTVRYARRGDVLGVAAFVGGPPPVSVQAVTDSTLLSLNVGTLIALAQEDAGIGWAFAEELTRRLYDVLEELSGNVFGSVRQRVARHLLDLAERAEPGRPLLAHVSQQELADAVGSVREVVARVLGELRRLELIEVSSRGIALLDPKGLFDQTLSDVE